MKTKRIVMNTPSDSNNFIGDLKTIVGSAREYRGMHVDKVLFQQ